MKKAKLTEASRRQTYLSPSEYSQIQKEAAAKEKMLKQTKKTPIKAKTVAKKTTKAKAKRKLAKKVIAKTAAKKALRRANPYVGAALGAKEIVTNAPKIVKGVKGLYKDLKSLRASKKNAKRLKAKYKK